MGPSLLWSLLPLPVGAGAREEGGQRRDGDGRVWSSPLSLTVPAALKVRGGVGGWKECLKEACTAVMGIVGIAGSGRQE